MARFVNSEIRTDHLGVIRVTRGFEALASFNAVHAVLGFLALVGTPARRLGAKISSILEQRAEARKARREDERLWNVALTDARVMADLSRAMSRDAGRDVRGFY